MQAGPSWRRSTPGEPPRARSCGRGRGGRGVICPSWSGHTSYGRATLTNDLVAALIVTIMLIPQSLAYALLAGLPPEVGLYASILPLVAYAVFGTSRTLAIGPVAVTSLMTAAAVGKIAAPGSPGYLEAAIVLALLSGLILAVMGLFRLGFVANFLSHPVVAGFITASGIIIAASQVKHLLGVTASGETLVEIIASLGRSIGQIKCRDHDAGGHDPSVSVLGPSRAEAAAAAARPAVRGPPISSRGRDRSWPWLRRSS